MVSAIRQHESATGTHMSPPSWTFLHSPPYPTPVGCHRASALGYLCHLANSHWLYTLYMILYMIQCSSLKSSHPYLFWPQRYKTRYQLQGKKNLKTTNIWRLNYTLLSNQQVTEESERKVKNTWNRQQQKHNNPKPMGCSKSRSKREVYSSTSLPQEREECKISNLNLHLKQLEKELREDKMLGWHHQFNGQEFEQTPGDKEGHTSMACCRPWGH